MSRRSQRAKLSADEDDEDGDGGPSIFGVKIPFYNSAPAKASLLFLLWAVMMVASAYYNRSRGFVVADQQIAESKELFESCQRDIVVLKNFHLECLEAEVKSKLPVENLAWDHMVANTWSCVSVSCIDIVGGLIEKTGYLFIGLGLTGMLLFYITARFWLNSSSASSMAAMYAKPAGVAVDTIVQKALSGAAAMRSAEERAYDSLPAAYRARPAIAKDAKHD